MRTLGNEGKVGRRRRNRSVGAVAEQTSGSDYRPGPDPCPVDCRPAFRWRVLLRFAVDRPETEIKRQQNGVLDLFATSPASCQAVRLRREIESTRR